MIIVRGGNVSESIENNMKKAEEAYAEKNDQKCVDYCNLVLMEDPEHDNAKVMKAMVFMSIYSAESFKKGVKEALEVLNSISNPRSITEEYRARFMEFIISYIESWADANHEHTVDTLDSVESRGNDNSILEQLIRWILSGREWRRNSSEEKLICLFLNELAQMSWLQSYDDFIYYICMWVKIDYKYIKKTAKVLLNAHKKIIQEEKGNIDEKFFIAHIKLKDKVLLKKILSIIKGIILVFFSVILGGGVLGVFISIFE